MEEFKNNLPIISIGLLILGTINVIIYYNYFNIDILSYLDFTEVLQIQFKLFAITGAIVIGFIMFITAAFFISEFKPNLYEIDAFTKLQIKQKRKELLESKNVLLPEEEITADFKKASIKEHQYYTKLGEQNEKEDTEITPTKILVDRYKFLSLGAPIFLIPLILPLLKNISQQAIYDIHLVSIPLFAIFTLVSYLGLRKDSIFAPNEIGILQKKRNLYKIGCLFVLLAYAGGSYARASAINLAINASISEVSLKTKNTIVKTNKYYRYIGKTKNYLFFYDLCKRRSDVIKIDDVEYLSIEDGVEYK